MGQIMKRKFKRKNEKKHILVILLIIIVTAAAVVGAAAVIFRVNTIEYIGDDHYSDEELTEKLLHEARVFITPGFLLGIYGKRYIRISLCAKEEKLAEALERIKKIM